MSGKVKFSSNSSTPVKKKLSASPVKGNKYKSFLASVLTPSHTKKWLKRKKTVKSEDLMKENKTEIDGIYKDTQLSDEFSEPAYSSIQDLRLKHVSYQDSVVDSSSAPSTKLSENMHESSSHLLRLPEPSSLNTSQEPLYAVVNKQPKVSRAVGKNVNTLNKNLIDEQKEEIKLLVERMKELTSENRELHKSIERIIREEKWKEDSLHAELKLKITQLEANTHKEVKRLSEQIKTLVTERKVLSDEIHILHEEKQLLQVKYEDVCCKMKSMASREFLKKVVEEHEKSLKQTKKKHAEDLKILQQENVMLLESKFSLIGEVEGLKEKINLLTAKCEKLKISEQELLQERSRILPQLEDSRHMQQEAQNTLMSLLKITETISIERDVLINKASFQDHQQKCLQTSIVDYSLNMGRLQEHFSNLSREKLEELQKLKTGESERDESLKNFYGRQLEILRSKIVSQSNTINDLESEKNKLELQLESLWNSTYKKKSKMEDLTCNILTNS